LKINDYDKALDHALLEYNRRPENIDVNETVAWVYYLKGEYAKALPYIRVALKTNSKNPTLLCHAGLIYEKAGERALAKDNLRAALQSNPNITEELRTKSVIVLKTL
jgi:tetratricopeptide (TPR) repeat protein